MVILMFLSLSCFCFLCFNSSAEAEIVDKVIAAVNGEPITMSSLKKRMTWRELELSKSEAKGKEKEKEDPAKGALDELIDEKLQIQEAKRLGVIVMDDELQLGVSQKRTQFSAILRKIGLTEEELNEDVKDEIMIRKMVDRKFKLFLEVSDAEAATYYEQNRAKFFEPEKIKIQQVLVGIGPETTGREKAEAKLKANEILIKLRELRDLREKGKMEEMKEIEEVKEIYKDDETVVVKVEADYVEPLRLLPMLSNAINDLKVGEFSKIIETPIGYFILKLEGRQPKRQKQFPEVMETIKTDLLEEKVKSELKSWLNEEREKSDIRIIDESLVKRS